MLIIVSCCGRQVSVRTVNTAASCRVSHSAVTKHACMCVCLFFSLTCSSVDVMEEAKKLIGTGNKHLVMGDVVSAVGVFQDACRML